MSYANDILDSRMLQEELQELLDEREALADECAEIADALYVAEHAEEPDPTTVGSLRSALESAREAYRDFRDGPDEDRIGKLTELKEDLDGMGWEHGIQLIADWHFEEYAQQLAEDMGSVDPEAGWPSSYIDWEAAADALKMDYTTVTFDGDDYYYREA